MISGRRDLVATAGRPGLLGGPGLLGADLLHFPDVFLLLLPRRLGLRAGRGESQQQGRNRDIVTILKGSAAPPRRRT
jgi:hypothetical protein